MDQIIAQVFADIDAAQSLELLGQIYGWSATNITDPNALQQIAAACQAKDAQLRAMGFAPPLVMDAPPRSAEDIAAVQRAANAAIDVAGIHPVSTTPPGWLAVAADMGVATRNATGSGGLPALDALRVTMVDLTAAAWDCGIDLTLAPHIKDVQTATPEQIWEMATYMLDAIRTQLAIQKNKK